MAKGILTLEDGREVEIEYNPDDYERKNPYERVNVGEKYWCINESDVVTYYEEDKGYFNNAIYKYGNYVNDEKYCEKVSRANNLINNLRRFSLEHDGDKIDWCDINKTKHTIGFNYNDKKLFVSTNWWCRNSEAVYFYTIETAKQAIEEFKDELMWFYTESGL